MQLYKPNQKKYKCIYATIDKLLSVDFFSLNLHPYLCLRLRVLLYQV